MNAEAKTEQDTLEFGDPEFAERAEPVFLAEGVCQKRPMYRVRNNPERIYFTYNENTGDPIYFGSVTEMCDREMPKGEGYLRWIGKWGYARAKAMATEAAHYGTLMHILIARFMTSQEINTDIDYLEGEIDAYFRNEDFCEDDEEEVIPYNTTRWAGDLQKDLLSFNQWVIDYEVKILAVELVVGNEDLGLAGAMDIVCEKNAKKYTEKTPPEKRKRVVALVDEKRRRDGQFWDSHILQVHTYAELANREYPEGIYRGRQIEEVANWSPKNWREESGPTYNYKVHTESAIKKKLPAYFDLHANHELNLKPKMEISGVIKLGESPAGNIRYIPANEYIKKNRTRPSAPRRPDEDPGSGSDSPAYPSQASALAGGKT